ncbi:hypothetical protein AK830_g9480 [Neonectria ditissima]|uniref:Amidoligase enzyme n=1 Tax=Neonectria ditissima TaxID=78410 RepID=A0A0P7B9D0_9HYPO|nr:hypothetical protein AK830_g9480 [Neonectria ditissima]
MPLSIGLEVEGVATRRTTSSQRFPNQVDQQMRIIASALREAGLDCRVYFPSGTRGTGPDFSVWNVTVDITVIEVTSGSSADASAFQGRFGFEIITPVFYQTENDFWIQELRTGINSIADAVVWKANRSTGLHVHVGRGANDAVWTLQEIQRIAAFYIRFEDAVDELHLVHRRSDNDCIESNRHNDMLKGLTTLEIYQRIRETGSIDEICQIMNYCEGEEFYDGYTDSRFFKVNFTSLLKHRTIEFRQHEGTTNPETMIQWSRFILKFVNFAIDASFDMITAPGGSFEDLQQLIGPGRG